MFGLEVSVDEEGVLNRDLLSIFLLVDVKHVSKGKEEKNYVS